MTETQTYERRDQNPEAYGSGGFDHLKGKRGVMTNSHVIVSLRGRAPQNGPDERKPKLLHRFDIVPVDGEGESKKPLSMELEIAEPGPYAASEDGKFVLFRPDAQPLWDKKEAQVYGNAARAAGFTGDLNGPEGYAAYNGAIFEYGVAVEEFTYTKPSRDGKKKAGDKGQRSALLPAKFIGFAEGAAGAPAGAATSGSDDLAEEVSLAINEILAGTPEGKITVASLGTALATKFPERKKDVGALIFKKEFREVAGRGFVFEKNVVKAE